MPKVKMDNFFHSPVVPGLGNILTFPSCLMGLRFRYHVNICNDENIKRVEIIRQNFETRQKLNKKKKTKKKNLAQGVSK